MDKLICSCGGHIGSGETGIAIKYIGFCNDEPLKSCTT